MDTLAGNIHAMSDVLELNNKTIENLKSNLEQAIMENKRLTDCLTTCEAKANEGISYYSISGLIGEILKRLINSK